MTISDSYQSQYLDKELTRQRTFAPIWHTELDKVFADVADYYDRANRIASLGLWAYIQKRFLATIDLKPGQRVLDVCAGTHAVGISLLKTCPNLEVHGMDRSRAMLVAGARRANARSFHITSTVADVHQLPYPDNRFDVVTLQWSSRHIRVLDAFHEIKRVLKPGGWFYHCDLLKPRSRWLARLYYSYLTMTLSLTAWLFHCHKAALNCRHYFLKAIQLFYTTEELADLIRDVGFEQVTFQGFSGGLVGFHKARKPD